jgi:hypothetical protein
MLVRWIDPLRTAFAVTLLVALVWAMVNLVIGHGRKINVLALCFCILWVVIGIYARCVVSLSVSDRRLLS